MKTYNKLLETFEHNLKSIEKQYHDLLQLATKAIELCETTLETLKEQVKKNDFKSKSNEIHFFKTIKPQVFGTLIFYVKLYDIEFKAPKGRIKQRLMYFNHYMDDIQRYYNSHVEFYRYQQNELTHLDEQYFLRDNKGKSFHSYISNYITEKYFSTSHDSTLAKLLAYNKLELYFIFKINQLENNHMETTVNPFNKQSKLQWTGKYYELVELAYSLNASGRVNNGNADIKEIMLALQEIFNTEGGDCYNAFSDIRGRKTNITKFIDKLKESLLRYMKDLDDLKRK